MSTQGEILLTGGRRTLRYDCIVTDGLFSEHFTDSLPLCLIAFVRSWPHDFIFIFAQQLALFVVYVYSSGLYILLLIIFVFNLMIF